MPVSNSIDNLLEANVHAAVNILDESVQSGQSKTYTIFCSIDASLIALSLFDARQTKFYGLETFSFSKLLAEGELSEKIRLLKRESALLKQAPYHKISVQFSNNRYTFIPSALFRAEDAEKYLFLNHSRKPNSRVDFEPVKSYDLVNVFSIEQQMMTALKNTFEDFTIHHHTTSLLHSVKLQTGTSNNKTFWVHFRNGWVDVMVTEDKKLVLCNSFNYKSTEDAVYYILLICDQLGLNPLSTELTIMGEIEKESAIAQLLHKYFENIQFSERTKAAQFSYGFDKLPGHSYYSVFSHALCE
jgi:hypothetical protein